eukprot:285312_1
MTTPMMSTEQETEPFAPDSESAHAVRIIQPKKAYYWCSFRYIALTVIVIILIAAIICGIYIHNITTPTNEQVTDYVLPNTTLTIISNHDTMITGQFIIDNEIKYNFVSISNNSIKYIEFQQISQLSITNQQWNGFKIYHVDNKQLTIELISSNNKPYTIIMDHSKNNISSNEVQLLESFLSNILCQHFVELSVKLGSIGYFGQTNHAIEDIHRFAQWIWSVTLDNKNIDNSQWVDLREEFEKVNRMAINSLDNTYETSRKLLQDGNCGDPYMHCNNSCHGRCGKGCSCWKWVCGTCDCWTGCKNHDEMCCINGYWSYCCLNIFWVTCDGSMSCE